ncbi:TPA: hypothetical protein J1299_003900 [Escherichia coli]|nr:hypothetical protein [Escherichia coli]EFJ2779162.1 hypothetical protein [Escherichia coli]EFJ2868925.1 hypothetical protein [Escherichia coli]EGO4766206.1 hypothetical protein [Escherichia coli]EHR2698348.1 hypothetical protein [Escherichia coli]
MKKTLIALAVAASAAVSGSAMAWTQNGTGGSVDLGGTLTPTDVITPWEVKVGAAVNGLDADIRKGDTKVNIPVKNAIPVLSIRTVGESFVAQSGVAPQIDYHGKIDFADMTDGVAKLKLEVKSVADEKIGTLNANIFTGAGVARNSVAGNDAFSGFASEVGRGFFGGVGNDASMVVSSLDTLKSRLNAIDSEITAHFNQMQKEDVGTWNVPGFSAPEGGYFSAFYGSGIEQGKTIVITLDQAASGDAPIQWKASLPVTVSYM